MRSRPEGKADRERRRKNPSKTPLPFFFKKNSLSSLLSLGRQAPRPLGGRPTARARPALARDAPGPGHARRPRAARKRPLDDGRVPRARQDARLRLGLDRAPPRRSGPARGGGRVVRAEGKRGREGGGGGGGRSERSRRGESAAAAGGLPLFLLPCLPSPSFLRRPPLALRDEPPRHLGLAVPDDRPGALDLHRGRGVRRLLAPRRQGRAHPARGRLQPARLRGVPAPLRLLPGPDLLRDAALRRRGARPRAVRQGRDGQDGRPRRAARPVAPAARAARRARGRRGRVPGPPRRVLRGRWDGGDRGVVERVGARGAREAGRGGGGLRRRCCLCSSGGGGGRGRGRRGTGGLSPLLLLLPLPFAAVALLSARDQDRRLHARLVEGRAGRGL